MSLQHLLYSPTAKFNCTVPGTLSDFIDECNITTTATVPTVTVSTIYTTTVTSTSFSLTSNSNPFDFEIGSTLFLVMMVLGGGIILLTFSIIMVCVVIGFLAKRKRKLFTVTPQENLNIYAMDQLPIDYQQQQQGTDDTLHCTILIFFVEVHGCPKYPCLGNPITFTSSNHMHMHIYI